MHITLPDKVKHIIGILEDEGYEAYAVGGCVRDSLLNRIPNDWDITTNASPLIVKSLFKRTIDTGIKHGTVTIMLENEGFEVTTYRIDGEYEDLRHPKEVIYTDCLREDLKRRDFTINAMAYNDRCGLVDEFKGIDDLNNHIIRAVGNANERFGEDALRILRAIRFAAQLDYTVEEDTLAAATALKDKLKKISAERIREELEKILISNNPERILDAHKIGITSVVLPEFDEMMETWQNHPHHMYSVGMHTVKALEASKLLDFGLTESEKRILRIAILLHDVGKPLTKSSDANGKDHFYGHEQKSAEMAKNILRRLKYDNDTIGKVERLIKYHDYRDNASDARVRRVMVNVGDKLMPIWFCLRRADISAQSELNRAEKLAIVSEYEKRYKDILLRGDCISQKAMAITGKDLMDIGYRPSKELGEVLNRLFDEVLEIPERNKKEYLIGRAYELMKNK